MEFVEEIKKFWKLWSTWVFISIGAFPDVYNGIATMGWADEIPSTAKWILRGLAGFGVFVRIIKQRVKDDTITPK